MISKNKSTTYKPTEKMTSKLINKTRNELNL